jgi:hypothetical protein
MFFICAVFQGSALSRQGMGRVHWRHGRYAFFTSSKLSNLIDCPNTSFQMKVFRVFSLLGHFVSAVCVLAIFLN